MIHLLIKGDEADARSAAAAHDILLHVSDTSYCDDIATQSFAYCDDQYLLVVMDWFNETTRAPYPLGALLFFNPETQTKIHIH